MVYYGGNYSVDDGGYFCCGDDGDDGSVVVSRSK